MDQATALGILRHLLTAGGAVLVTNGLVNDGQLQTIVGAIVTIAPIIWSVIQKRQQKTELAAAKAAPAIPTT